MNELEQRHERARQEEDFYLALAARIIIGVIVIVALLVGSNLGTAAIKRYKGVQVIEVDAQ